jgi:hypothetical protein
VVPQSDSRRSSGPKSSGEAPHGLDLGKAITALIALQIADREDRLDHERAPRPTEEILVNSGGLTYTEVSQLTGKGYEAVKGIVRRARGRGSVAKTSGDSATPAEKD